MQQEKEIICTFGRTCSTYLSPTWSCTWCVCNWSIQIKAVDNDCTPHVRYCGSTYCYSSV